MNYKVTNKNILMYYIIIVNLYIKKVKNMNDCWERFVFTHTVFKTKRERIVLINVSIPQEYLYGIVGYGRWVGCQA